ncbi:AMP-binding protein [Alkalihalobacillus sp. AL-G]|uniref:AMP-binding protein n=1 Tax=Alkalihalobacillus sp. AL-G TaxID=2926399 RepID=UPI00272BF1D9|nr:AMP-binding protein [Alkalihalobacillus sp. AL-G]WLD91701.1 AMP-binding protein [Alkalihalobacillus sp. AL-G]
MLLTDGFSLHANKNPNKIAIQTKQRQITYGELHCIIDQTANALLSIKKGKKSGSVCKAAFLLDNSIEFFQIFLAAAKIGWIAVPLDPKWNNEEIDEILEKTCPDVLVIQGKHLRKLSNKTISYPLIIAGRHQLESYDRHFVSFEQWVEQKPVSAPRINKLSQHSPFYMGFTSGTTGTPKAFTRSHRSWVESFNGSNVEFGINSHDHTLIPGPLVHSLFLYASIHTLSIGGTVHLLEKFSAMKAVELMENRPVTVVYVVPTMFEAICRTVSNVPAYRRPAHLRDVISSGAKWSAASKKQIADLFPGVNLYEFYGASELSFVTVLDPKGNLQKPDSVGRPFHNIEISLRDSHGMEVETGEVGKLYVKSEMIFSGYYQNEDESKKVLQDGWATVGDLARRDNEGYVYIVGREKNMIIYGGLNVYPEEIEKVLRQLPEIQEAVVLGIKDDYWGEKIVAIIKFNKGNHLKEREVQAYCRKRLAKYKCPREVIPVEAFPHTNSGKIARKRLEQWLETRKKEFYE